MTQLIMCRRLPAPSASFAQLLHSHPHIHAVKQAQASKQIELQTRGHEAALALPEEQAAELRQVLAAMQTVDTQRLDVDCILSAAAVTYFGGLLEAERSQLIGKWRELAMSHGWECNAGWTLQGCLSCPSQVYAFAWRYVCI